MEPHSAGRKIFARPVNPLLRTRHLWAENRSNGWSSQMESIDGIKYPDADEDLLKDRKLGDMYRKFLKGQMADENSDFIDAVRKKYDPKKQYPLYLKKRRPQADQCRLQIAE